MIYGYRHGRVCHAGIRRTIEFMFMRNKYSVGIGLALARGKKPWRTRYIFIPHRSPWRFTAIGL